MPKETLSFGKKHTKSHKGKKISEAIFIFNPSTQIAQKISHESNPSLLKRFIDLTLFYLGYKILSLKVMQSDPKLDVMFGVHYCCQRYKNFFLKIGQKWKKEFLRFCQLYPRSTFLLKNGCFQKSVCCCFCNQLPSQKNLFSGLLNSRPYFKKK